MQSEGMWGVAVPTLVILKRLPQMVAVVSLIGLLGAATAVHVPTQTPVKVRLASAISSAHAQSGDPVPLVVAENVVVAGYVVIAKGAEGAAEVDAVDSATADTPGSLTLAFKWVRAVDGSKIGVDGRASGAGQRGTSNTDNTSTLSDTAASAAAIAGSAGSYGAATILGNAGSMLSNLGLGHHAAKAGDGSIAQQRSILLAVRNPLGVTILSSQQADATDADIK